MRAKSRLKFHSLCSLWASSDGISVVFSRLFVGIPANVVTMVIDFYGGHKGTQSIVEMLLTFWKVARSVDQNKSNTNNNKNNKQ